jgi:phosphoribosylanthranilate isomerase
MLIKICGLMDPETARFAVRQGAHYIGLLFSKKSTRAIALDKAKEIVVAVREAGGEPVAVFADETLEQMISLIEALDLHLVQLHGDVPRSFCHRLSLPKIYVADGKPLPASLDPAQDFLLFENHFEDPKGFRFFIAGNLHADNVADAIKQLKPDGVDVSRGAREKDAIAAFIQKARPGRFGAFGGMYVPEILVQPLKELDHAFQTISIEEELREFLHHYAGRPTAITEAPNFSKAVDGPRIFLKREDLLHTGAHKINNAIGQVLLAKKMGKTRVIAETGAGQHGVAVATACALLGLECVIYMGQTDIARQAPNVDKMELLGAKVVPVSNGAATLKDAINEALRDGAAHYESTHYCLGSALGPHPFPAMVAKFQEVIGKEAKQQMRARVGRDPDLCIACVGGGSNAIGLFSAFLAEPHVRLIGVEAAGAARFQKGSAGVLHGTYSFLLQDENGQIQETHSISAGLDYPGVGPQHAALHASERVTYDTCDDEEALAALKLLAKTEGIIPALESAHALGYLIRIAPTLPKEAVVLVNLSGRGDKDVAHIASLCQ